MTIDDLILKWEEEADEFHKIVENPERQEMRLPAIATEDQLRVCIMELKLVKNNVGLGSVIGWHSFNEFPDHNKQILVKNIL